MQDYQVPCCASLVWESCSPEWNETRRTNAGAKYLDDLYDAGKQIDKGGELTKAGRAAQKHGSRPGSVFPPATGNPSAINKQGQGVLEDILTSPNQTTKPNRFGGQDIYGGGRGVRYDSDGNFMGFLEP